MGFILLIQTILNCLLTGVITKRFWFSYILFLIFIGGILILFIYMASLASNEKLKFNINPLVGGGIRLITVLLRYTLWDKFYFINFINNSDFALLSEITLLINENHLSLTKIYDSPNNSIIIIIIIYLLLTLIIIVKITNLYQGPLRPKNF